MATAKAALKKTLKRTRKSPPPKKRPKKVAPKKSRRTLPAKPQQGCIVKKYSLARHVMFMEALKKKALVYVACKACGISKVTAYNWRKEVTGFAAEWDDIIAGRMEDLEAETFERAIRGVEEPVYYQGVICGHVRKPSDGLAMFLLRANNPAKYDRGKGIQIEGQGEFSLSINDMGKDITESEVPAK